MYAYLLVAGLYALIWLVVGVITGLML